MNNRSQLLSEIGKWQAFKMNPSSIPDSKEWNDAHEAYENALYEAGVYKEALRGQRALNEESRTQTEEPERTFFHWAHWYAGQKPEVLKALHKAKSYAARTAILDGIQAALNKAERKKEEARAADCQRRTAALIEETRKDAEQAKAEKEREEQHKAKRIVEAAARDLPKKIPAANKRKKAQ